MAASSKISFILFLITFLSAQKIHARESQFFNKIPSNNNLANENQPKEEDPLDKLEQEPNFIPENQNAGYGLYGHESGQLPPSTTTTTTTTPTTSNTNLPFKNQPNEFVPKYLPKNYNTEAYVTPTASNTDLPFNNEPNEFVVPKYLPKNYNTESYVTPTTTTSNTNLPYNNEPNELLPKYLPKNYNTESYVTEPEGYHSPQETNTINYYNAENRNYHYPASTTAANGDHYDLNYAGNSYNGQNQGLNQYSLGQKGYTTTSTSENSNYYNAAETEKQGMSDTRFLENGKYFYDLSLEKNDRYPFDNSRRFGDQYRKYGGSYGNNNENTYELSNYSNNVFENKGEHLQDFQDDEDLP